VGWEALGEAAASQAEHQATEEPTRQFGELLTAAIATGDAHVADAKNDEEPDNAGHWGWRAKDGVSEFEGPYLKWYPQGKRIGWLDEDGSVLLEPGAAFAAAQRMAREQGTSLSIGQRTLWKRLAEKGLLASRDTGRDRNTTRATIAGERKTVVHVIPGVLSSSEPKGHSFW
jgi:hypothetical protein